MIKHVWFDFSETIASLIKETHNQLRYAAYSEVTHKPITQELIAEYENLYQKYSHSNAAIFRALGLSPNYWSDRINLIAPHELYRLMDDRIPNILQEIKVLIPISIFSNIKLDRILPVLDIDPSWFTHILSASMIKEPKPALEGFYKMVELTGRPPQEILYIGDHVEKDIRPAKQAGIQTGLLWSQSSEADYCFETFPDILSFLQKQ
ncbi:MAG: HAD family hydrolase [Candidatus Uhrbacteria bacterium]|nr:HAD family hydrolase [Candidatus Uhrbacteria bacterium]MDP3793322.1 HAD family hydrolase [Candidatus Uhrbacteria bacterium]